MKPKHLIVAFLALSLNSLGQSTYILDVIDSAAFIQFTNACPKSGLNNLFDSLHSYNTLTISGNSLENLPDLFGKLDNLTYLNFEGNAESVGRMKNLKTLRAVGSKSSQISADL
jgi:Leucine-rich repeat (LRR) protein